ncbi:MAG: glutamyl-tRNA reductase [Pseudomonadales bacterium]
MAVLAYGLNHQTAPIEVRERLAFPEEKLPEALADLRNDVPDVSEVAILSTCNRTELYCVTAGREQHISDWLSDRRRIAVTDLHGMTYQHWDQDAARHMIRVASGLDSQVLGEPQILGQMKSALETARAAGTLGPELTLLTNVSLNAAKQVRTDTDIGRNPVSVAFTAVRLAQQIFADLSEKKALLLGAGDTIAKVAEHLQQAGIGGLAIANRTLVNAELLASLVGAEAMQLTDVAGRLHQYDIVIGSTGSSLPILGKGTVEAAIRQRRRKPIFMVDIAVPRDIEPEVAELPDVYLYSIDDLTTVIEESTRSRQEAAQAAEALVSAGATRYISERRIQLDKELLTQLRGNASQLQSEELMRAHKDLERGADPKVVLERLAHNLTNKLMHAPTVGVRQASAEGRNDLLDWLKKIYQID